MQLRMMNDRVAVERIAKSEVSAGGLFIPEKAREKANRATVIAVGPKVTDLKANDVIVFGKYSGSEIKLEEKEILILTEDDILAVEETQ